MGQLSCARLSFSGGGVSQSTLNNRRATLGYIVMLRARMFRSLIPVLMIKERNIRARNITI